jgi:esterase/lipase superfamily enzyme
MEAPYFGMLYASDRKPISEPGEPYYSNNRGFELRLGKAGVKMGEGQYTWEEARQISLLKNRGGNYPLRVTAVEEIGILDRSVTVFTPPEKIPPDPKAPGKQFAELINAKLAISKKKDVYIYVHGYKVVFSNPILVATELWHYTAYDGVFIAFAWPSTPRKTAYMSDLETAVLSAYNLRKLVEFLAEDTETERIHILGYSAGTRVVLNALSQLMFMHKDEGSPTLSRRLRIGRVILVGSDFDRLLFGALLDEGILDTMETMTIYVSRHDKALGLSRWIFKRDRLGQFNQEDLDPTVAQYLKRTPKLDFIDVSDVEGATKGNGHAYFRNSPWASSDILMALMYDLEPDERGLVTTPERPVWTFPEDYIKRLKTALKDANPELFIEKPGQ